MKTIFALWVFWMAVIFSIELKPKPPVDLCALQREAPEFIASIDKAFPNTPPADYCQGAVK